MITNYYSSENIKSVFVQKGGIFVNDEFISNLPSIRAFVFDWDGVFNTGYKSPSQPSTFSEPDISGINLLRYSYAKYAGYIPEVVIITGERNESAHFLAARENFNFIFEKTADKKKAIYKLSEMINCSPSEIACTFDDYNDLSMAAICGVRFLINKPSNILFQHFLKENKWVDYITACIQPNNPIREITEVIMGLLERYEPTTMDRALFSDEYTEYMKKRSLIQMEVINGKDLK